MSIEKNGKIRTIEVMRIIATLGVFTGHFLGIGIASEYSLNILSYLRNSLIGKSVLAYFFEGDISVIFFYVVGGFLITYNFYRRGQDNKKIQWDYLRKIFQIVVPSIIVILITAFLSYLGYKCGLSNSFSLDELKKDIIRIIFGGGDDYIPYYAYQLWYIHRMVVGYICAYAFLGLTSEYKRLRYYIYIPVIIYFYVSYIPLAFIFIGAACGDVCIHLIKQRAFNKRNQKIGCSVLGGIGIIAGPMAYNEHSLGAVNQFVLASCMALTISMFVILHNNIIMDTFKFAKIIDWLNDKTFSFYCVHVIVLGLSHYIYDRMLLIWCDGVALLILNYIGTVIATLICADIFEKVVIKNVSRCFNVCARYF